MNKISGFTTKLPRRPSGFFSPPGRSPRAPQPAATNASACGILAASSSRFWGGLGEKGAVLSRYSCEGDAGGFTGLGFAVLGGTELDPSSLQGAASSAQRWQSQVRAWLGSSAPLQLSRFYRFHNSRLGFIHFVNEFCKNPRNVAGQVPALYPWQQCVPLAAALRAARRSRVGKKGAGGTEGTRGLSFPSCRDSRSLCQGVAAGPSPLLMSPGEQQPSSSVLLLNLVVFLSMPQVAAGPPKDAWPRAGRLKCN